MDLLIDGISFNLDYWKTKSEKLFTEQMKVKNYWAGPDQAAKIKEAFKQIKVFGKDEVANG